MSEDKRVAVVASCQAELWQDPLARAQFEEYVRDTARQVCAPANRVICQPEEFQLHYGKLCPEINEPDHSPENCLGIFGCEESDPDMSVIQVRYITQTIPRGVR